MPRRLLLSAERKQALARLAARTAAYYRSFSTAERLEDAALAQASAKAARRLVFDRPRASKRDR